jgi:tetratricopeptide (TPR) repeat protein
MAVAVVLLLIVVVVVFVVSSSDVTGNERILLEMEQLISAGQYDAAVARAGQADPAGDPRILAKIELQKQVAGNLKGKKGGYNAENEALRAYQQVESWIQQHRHDIPGTIAQWEALIRDHPGTHWAFVARQNMDHLLAGGKNPEGITLYPTGKATIDRAFEEVQKRVKALEDEDQFQNAINAFFDFWEEYKLLTTDLATWEKRVQDEVKGLEGRAEERYERLDELAKQYVKNGQYDAAMRMYRKVTDNFGIEKYTVQAEAALKKIRR